MQEINKQFNEDISIQLIPLSNTYTFSLQTLNQAQNRSKNKYVNKIRKFITKDGFPEENDYFNFLYNDVNYYLERKNRKSKIKLTGQPDTSALDKPKVDMADRIIQLEAENAVLRQKGDVHKTDDTKNQNMFSEMPAVEAQVVNVQPNNERINCTPGFVPIGQSPSLLWFKDMCRKDKHNFNPNKEKEWFSGLLY